jgi:hypothetical protein
MYLIVNTTKKSVNIDDLGVVFEGHQMLDLDKYDLPIRIEDSKRLREALKLGILKPMSSSKNKEEKKQEDGLNKQELYENIKKLIKEEVTNKNQPNNINKDIIDVLKELKSSIDTIKNSKNIIQNNTSNDSEKSDINVDIDDSKLIEIHSKAVSRLVKNTQGEIEYKNEQKEEKDLDSSIKELEGLI